MKAAILYPGKQNHWIVALPDTSDDLAERAEYWFRAQFPDEYEDLKVTGEQLGNPEDIQARYVSKDPDAGEYDLPTTAYVAIAFDYLGDEEFISWPEGGSGHLYAIVQGVPTVHLKSPIEEIGDILDDTVGDIKDDAVEAGENATEAAKTVSSIVIFGGAIAAAAWLYGVIRAK